MSATVESRTLPRLVVTGSPRERGRAQGESFRAMIDGVLQRWLESIAARHKVDPRAYLSDFLRDTSFVPTIERWTPGLLDEVRGIAESAGQTFETILTYNLMDEEWTYGTDWRRERPGCTVACLVPKGAAPVVAQTMDIPSLHDGTQVVVHHKPNQGTEALVFTGAGMIALNGANAAGLGVVVNNLSMLPSSRSGLPVMFVIRGILERESLDAAVNFVEAVPHAIGQHYAIGSPTGIAALEGAANGVVRAGISGSHYVHANHPIANDTVVGNPATVFNASSTFVRHDRAAELIEDVSDQLGIERLLMDVAAPISRSPKHGFMTFGGTSIECSIPPRMNVAPGPPHETAWLAVGF